VKAFADVRTIRMLRLVEKGRENIAFSKKRDKRDHI